MSFTETGSSGTEKPHKGRTLCEDEDTVRFTYKQATPHVASKPPEAGREAWNRFFLTALRRKEP